MPDKSQKCLPRRHADQPSATRLSPGTLFSNATHRGLPEINDCALFIRVTFQARPNRSWGPWGLLRYQPRVVAVLEDPLVCEKLLNHICVAMPDDDDKLHRMSHHHAAAWRILLRTNILVHSHTFCIRERKQIPDGKSDNRFLSNPLLCEEPPAPRPAQSFHRCCIILFCIRSQAGASNAKASVLKDEATVIDSELFSRFYRSIETICASLFSGR